MDIQKAISYWQKFRAECFEMLKEGTENDKRTAEEQIPVCDDTITVLQEQAEREKGCEYCDPEVMSGNPIFSRHADGYLGNGKFCSDSGVGVKACFCPHCGRRLK